MKKRIRKFLLEIILLLLIFNLQKVGIAHAEFIDDEKSVNNTLNAGTLDFAISAGDYSPVPLTPGIPAIRSASIIDSGSLSFNYDIHTVQTGGSNDFCNALNLEAKLDGITKYNGSLLGFVLSPAVLFGGSDSWDFIAKFDSTDPSLQNKTCDFNLVFRSWQTDSDGTWGFKDQEVLGNSVSSGHWVALVISNISHFIGTPGSPNQMKATVSWNTNEQATSNLKWRIDPDPSWTALTADTMADQTHHSRDIDGLLPETTYYVEVESADSAGNSATASYSFVTGILITGVDWYDDIVINEFLPNPIGDDAALMPGGEWIELYNRGSSTHDLQDWYLTDFDGHKLYLASGLNIAPGEFMVVYRNGDPNFDLDNSFLGDEVNLYSSTGELVDEHFYSVAWSEEVLENKSIARYPDGTDDWFDPIPSPGGPNVLEVQLLPTPTPSLEFSLRNDKKTVAFTVSNISAFEKISYEIVYDSIGEDKGIAGSADLAGENTFSRNDLLLGSCSGIEGKVCTYDEGITKLRCKVTLDGLTQVILEEEIDY